MWDILTRQKEAATGGRSEDWAGAGSNALRLIPTLPHPREKHVSVFTIHAHPFYLGEARDLNSISYKKLRQNKIKQNKSKSTESSELKGTTDTRETVPKAHIPWNPTGCCAGAHHSTTLQTPEQNLHLCVPLNKPMTKDTISS